MKLKRSAGILLHPTSLPGSPGVGNLGAGARYFVDRLSEAGIRWWQVLPLNPPGAGGSPYSATSAFAGNPTLLDLNALADAGWLTEAECTSFATGCETFHPREFPVDAVTARKREMIALAAGRWADDGGQDDPGYVAFCDDHQSWLDDYALFAALKLAHDEKGWQDWPEDLVRREPDALDHARKELHDSILAERFAQWQFFHQWSALRHYAAERGVHFIGDLPIFVAMDSADAWANRSLFELHPDGRADAVAGVPPDYFSETGQRWGNPLYNWEALKESGYHWWIQRISYICRTVDLVRVDHFRGFESYWRIPAEEPTAIHGEWLPGPSDHFFDALREALGEIPFIAEDLGIITDEVRELRDRQNLPGMKVLHFAFDGDPNHPFLPHRYPEHCVAYTGTHDNNTTRGWYKSLSDMERHHVRTYLAHPDDGIIDALVECLFGSRAALTILPAQDLFYLGAGHRMNTPGEPEGNWGWRMLWEELSDDQTFQRLGELVDRTQRRT